MERMAWTDERLDDLAQRMDVGFARVDADIRDLRAEVRVQGVELRGEIASVKTELGGEIAALRVTMVRFGAGMVGSMMVGFLGVIAAVLARG